MDRETEGGENPKSSAIASPAIPFDPEAERAKIHKKQSVPSKARIFAYAADGESDKTPRNEQADDDVQNEVAESVLALLDHSARLDPCQL